MVADLGKPLQSGQHLYFRDSRYFTQKQANGKPIFWSRGNGWVMGALVNVLSIMPADYPSRPKYIAQFARWQQRSLRSKAPMVCGVQGSSILVRTICPRCPAPRSSPWNCVRDQPEDTRPQDLSACRRKIVEGDAHAHLR